MAEPTNGSGGVVRNAVRLSPMQVPKASDVLADELRERILSGEFQEGTALPAERDLVSQTGMSRTTIREALRILEVQGLVRIKTGRSGGAFVQHPSEESIANSVSLLIRGRKIRIPALLQTREAIEPACARLAAQARTEQDLELLETANDDLAAAGSLDAFLQANIDWHVGVSVASHNELLTGFMLALSRAIYASTKNTQFVDADVRKTTVRAHRSVTAAIRAQDPNAAVRRMTRHVHTYAEAVLEVEERTDVDVEQE